MLKRAQPPEAATSLSSLPGCSGSIFCGATLCHHASISGEEFLHWDSLDLDLTLPELAVSWEPAWPLASPAQPLQVWAAAHLRRHGSLQSGSMSLHARPSGLAHALCRGRGSIQGKKELWEAPALQGKPELISHFCFLLCVRKPFLSSLPVSGWGLPLRLACQTQPCPVTALGPLEGLPL